MSDFILVHGAMHGAWCWDLVIPELEALGHRATAMDMPIDQPGLTMDDYAAHVADFVSGRDMDGAYLVGHSMGGFVIPLVAAKLPSARLIFLCAVLMHTNDAELRENMAATSPEFGGWLVPDSLGRVTMLPETAIEAFYHDTAPDLAAWAASRLRPQWPAFLNTPPAPDLADKVAGVIYTLDDRIIIAEAHRRLAVARYGREPIALPGDHSPFLSRPAELATALDGIVRGDAVLSCA
jgi:pimeloyl-ACP methyl ester carboxylesterase